MPTEHEHRFENDGVRHTTGERLTSGDARQRKYWRVYRCFVCMERRAEQVECFESTYDKVKFDSTPPTSEEREAIRRACL